ncbi:iron dicitrate transporter FecR [Leptospira kobayashii]|uniref:Iron dicitrate transporter FecR n=1 Tax=Leptospira kobayashii TaxID=1917830 RepID=A0ABN6KC72_9LEPT|nr:FecR family protein [Leptospira kobayashii]BDA78557.1 iron dicitrate transporter FecR [Leptospira kobayashii]
MNKKTTIRCTFTFILAFAMISNCAKPKNTTEGILTFTLGNITIERSGNKISAKTGDPIQKGDTLRSGEKSAAIVEFGEEETIIEIQSNSEFQFVDTGKNKELILNSGRSWLRSAKLQKDATLNLKTPTSVAGVRGTTFFTFVVGDMSLTCHCEGEVDLKSLKNNSGRVNDRDYLAFVKNDKIIYIFPEDLKALNIPYVHDHSELSSSKLGKQNKLTQEQFALVMQLAEKKFAELK